MWIVAWWMLDCVGFSMVYYKDKGEGEDHMSTVNVLKRKLRSLLSVR